MRARIVALGLVLLAATLAVASASTLDVRPGSLTSVRLDHPCPGTAAATASGTAVTFTLPAGSCAGALVDLTLVGSDGSVVGAGQATAGSSSAQLSLPTAGAVSAYATVDGWPVGVSWTAVAAGPIRPGTPDTVLTNIVWDLLTNNPTQVCFHGDVSTTSTTPVAWALDIDLSQPPFNGVAARTLSLQGVDGWRYDLARDTPADGMAQITGNVRGGRATIIAGQTYRVELCDWRLPDGVDTPSAYTVSTVPTTPWTDTHACLATTITGNGTSQFYVGWSTTVDMAPAVARLTDAGHVLDAWTYGPDEWKVDRTQTGPTTFLVTSDGPSTIAGTQSFTFITCAVDW